jgi:hypothetical protein
MQFAVANKVIAPPVILAGNAVIFASELLLARLIAIDYSFGLSDLTLAIASFQVVVPFSKSLYCISSCS